MNRKIERRGIPGSFSANLGRRTSSPREIDNRDATMQRNGGNTSVKAIVAWLESSSKDGAHSPTSISSDSRSKSSLAASTLSRTAAAAVTTPVKTQPSLPMAPDVEEYSLTLLKYQEYYTERPLGRCLDKKSETTVFSVKPVNGDQSPDANSPQSRVKKVPGDQVTLNEKDLESGKPGLNTSTRSSTSYKDDENRQQKNRLPSQRDSEEVKAFWAAVRSYLWISNGELEEVEDAEQRSTTIPLSLTPPKDLTDLSSYGQDDEGSHASQKEASPHRKVKSEPNVAAVMSRRRKSWKRFLSVEEKMSEIDAFLGTT